MTEYTYSYEAVVKKAPYLDERLPECDTIGITRNGRHWDSFFDIWQGDRSYGHWFLCRYHPLEIIQHFGNKQYRDWCVDTFLRTNTLYLRSDYSICRLAPRQFWSYQSSSFIPHPLTLQQLESLINENPCRTQ
jgi:hypothetical protein